MCTQSFLQLLPYFFQKIKRNNKTIPHINSLLSDTLKLQTSCFVMFSTLQLSRRHTEYGLVKNFLYHAKILTEKVDIKVQHK